MATPEMKVEIDIATFQETVAERISTLEADLLITKATVKKMNQLYFEMVERFNQADQKVDMYRARYGELEGDTHPDPSLLDQLPEPDDIPSTGILTDPQPA